MQVYITKDVISVISKEPADHKEFFEVLNSLEGDEADQVLEVMPKNYNYIMNVCEYGKLFACGSPQLCECGWRIELVHEGFGSKMYIWNFR